MKLLKPSWINLDGRPIFSVDIHPNGHCVATGGMGEDCGQIVVWNMSPIQCREDETAKSVPKAFCELSNHEACVNVVRWSPDGQFLASGITFVCSMYMHMYVHSTVSVLVYDAQ